ncbi:hypothetical protein [Alloyangia mangrovi]|uniref:hypothetical protein n=1 Tax=Alloyangia mangrovi TaxID=1779329 RepID=UPI0021A34E3E|nr:hypothetical protein [Alloyangia mangrovi]
MPVMPMPRAASIAAGGRGGEPGHGIGGHREQRIEHKREEGGGKADAGDAERLGGGIGRGHPAEDRDHDAEHGERGNGLQKAQDRQRCAAQAGVAVAQDAERKADQRCGTKRAECEGEMAQGSAAEGVLAAGILLHHRQIRQRAGQEQRGQRGQQKRQEPGAGARPGAELREGIGHQQHQHQQQAPGPGGGRDPGEVSGAGQLACGALRGQEDQPGEAEQAATEAAQGCPCGDAEREPGSEGKAARDDRSRWRAVPEHDTLARDDAVGAQGEEGQGERRQP